LRTSLGRKGAWSLPQVSKTAGNIQKKAIKAQITTS